MAKLLRFAVVVVVLTAATSIGAPSYTVTILHPSGFDNSFAVGVSGGQQVGYSNGTATGYFTGAIGVCI